MKFNFIIIRVLGIVILFFICFSSQTQTLGNYHPLISNGVIPSDFITLPSEKYYSELKLLDQKDNGLHYKLKQHYLLQSNYYIDYLLNSGYVMFNDSISRYVNTVADNLLKNEPELRKNIRIYTIKSSEVNAFATDKGILFITVGLLAQIQSEAQLAWVLSHEIIHFKYLHSIDSYIASEEILKGEGDFAGATKEVKLSSIFAYSKENEMEADQKGLEEFYSKSDYSLDEVRKIFDVLLYSYLPIEEIDFKKEFFETPNFQFPDTYTIKEATPITAIEGYDDSQSTHPNIKKRREEINKLIERKNSAGKNRFSAFSEKEFNNIRQIARYELCNIYLYEHQYEDAIYAAYSIMKKDSISDHYLQSVIGRSLYGLCKYKNRGSYNDVHLNYKKTEGSKSNLVYFFDQISKKELNVLSLSHLWRLNNNSTKDTSTIEYAYDMLKDLVAVNKLLPDSFYYQNEISSNSSLPDTLTEAQIAKLDKYEKIKYKRKQQGENILTSSNYNHALSDLLTEDKFKNKFEEYKKTYADNEENNSYTPVRHRRKKSKTLQVYGIKKIVVINPLFYLSKRVENSVEPDYLVSEKKEIELINTLKSLSQKTGLELEVLDNKTFNKDDVNKFNDYMTMSNWIDERISLDDTMTLNVSMNNAKEIAKKYGTNYFTWLIVDVKPGSYRKRVGEFLKYSATVFGFPIGFLELTKSVQSFSIGIYVFDVTNNKVVFSNSYQIKQRISNDIINSYLYSILYQISSTPKQKK